MIARATLVRDLAVVLASAALAACACSEGEAAPDAATVSDAAAVPDAARRDAAMDPADSGGADAAACMPCAPADPPLLTVAQWEERFLESWDREHETDYLPRSRSADSWQHYNLAYGIDANVSMFEATGDLRYLDRALEYVENVISVAAPSSSFAVPPAFGDEYLGWVSALDATAGEEVPLYESYCWRYAMHMLRVMHDTPAIARDPGYRARYDAILAFAERNVFDKWVERGTAAYVYRERTHMAAHWAFIALDLALLTEDDARRERALAILDDIDHHLPDGSSLRGQMGPHPTAPGGVFWDQYWGAHDRPGQDVSHGNGVVSFVVEAIETGHDWTRADADALVVTLGVAIWRPDGTAAEFVDGSGDAAAWFNDGFCKLGRYDVAIQRRLETHDTGRNIQLRACGALNARLLADRCCAP